MNEEIREAIEAASSVDIRTDRPRVRRARYSTLRARIKEFLRQVPEGTTVRELLDEL